MYMYFYNIVNLIDFILIFRIEVFDSDKIGKDKSLGSVEFTSKDLGAGEPMWFPLKGVKSGQLLMNSQLLNPGEVPSGKLADGKKKPIKGNACVNSIGF